ncbi:HNH endonuclease [Pseudomonas chlororaphis]|uniref:HNH endonuclease n=1 Tax=Pseudomonas chlororaphis TaxID=587753 RepID=UPI002365FCED|nr:HNH endonuclease [Pseudomonas chlororaphis]WDH23626.1 HNH endonuclease [Pseudomonas chlororaphis]
MTHGPTHIPSRGICIYCKRSEVRLADEHILPYFIGGAHILKDASCGDCAKITSNFEREVSRDLWGDARVAFDAPSRRKKKRPKVILMPDQYNPGQYLRIPAEDYPAAMVFYRMHKAGILQGLPEQVDLSPKWELTSITDTAKNERFTLKYGQPPIVRFRHVPDSFARLLAKIAYGQVLCSLDPDDFRPVCLPYILGQKKNLSYIVGGRWSYPEMQPGIGYEMRTNCIRFPGRLLIIVEIQIYPNNGTPAYHVLVGDVEGHAESDRVFAKVEATYSVDVTDIGLYKPVADDAFHWMPSSWPLPAWAD